MLAMSFLFCVLCIWMVTRVVEALNDGELQVAAILVGFTVSSAVFAYILCEIGLS